MITYQTEGVEMPDIKKRETTAWIKAVAESYGKRVGEIAYIFCSDEKILEVNRQYLQHDYYTDIITFDYCEGNRIAGDLFISLDTVRTNAEQFGAAYETELHRVIIHGILYLVYFYMIPLSISIFPFLPQTQQHHFYLLFFLFFCFFVFQLFLENIFLFFQLAFL